MQSEGPANRAELDEEGRVIRRTIAEESGLADYLGPEMNDLLLGLKVERNAITGCPASLGQYAALLERIVTFAQRDSAFDAALMRSLADNYLGQLRAAKNISHKMPKGVEDRAETFLANRETDLPEILNDLARFRAETRAGASADRARYVAVDGRQLLGDARHVLRAG